MEQYVSRSGLIRLESNEQLQTNVVQGTIELDTDRWKFSIANPLNHRQFSAYFAPQGKNGFGPLMIDIVFSAPNIRVDGRRRNCEMERKPTRLVALTLSAMLIQAFDTGHLLEEAIIVQCDQMKSRHGSVILAREVTVGIQIPRHLVEDRKLKLIS